MALTWLRYRRISVVLFLVIFAVDTWGIFIPGSNDEPEDWESPDQENRQKWIDYISLHPIGRLYRLYRDLDGVGIDFNEFDLLERPLRLDDIHPDDS